MAEYKPIRAHGGEEFWGKVQLLAELRGTSLGALVQQGMEIAYGKELALLKTHVVPGVVNNLHELQPEADHA